MWHRRGFSAGYGFSAGCGGYDGIPQTPDGFYQPGRGSYVQGWNHDLSTPCSTALSMGSSLRSNSLYNFSRVMFKEGVTRLEADALTRR